MCSIFLFRPKTPENEHSHSIWGCWWPGEAYNEHECSSKSVVAARGSSQPLKTSTNAQFWEYGRLVVVVVVVARGSPQLPKTSTNAWFGGIGGWWRTYLPPTCSRWIPPGFWWNRHYGNINQIADLQWNLFPLDSRWNPLESRENPPEEGRTAPN